MQTGQPFNPFRLFTGIFIPEGLVRANGISPGAKLTYGRLRYAGQDGECYPAVPTLAAEIGVCVRQTQYYVSELEREKLIRRVTRLSDGGQTSNAYQFLWHQLLGTPVKEIAPGGVQNVAPEGVQDLAPKESQIEESQLEENCDLDYPPTNRKKRDSRLESRAAICKKYPRLQEVLADYMTAPGDERFSPSARLVVDVMDAAGGASEDEVIRCLRYLREERGLRPGAKNGPHHFSWFKPVVADYFAQKRDRDLVTGNGPVAAAAGALPREVFQAMTEVLE
jgi:Helix-turn-helix domain